jgi:hypothetical protein
MVSDRGRQKGAGSSPFLKSLQSVIPVRLEGTDCDWTDRHSALLGALSNDGELPQRFCGRAVEGRAKFLAPRERRFLAP